MTHAIMQTKFLSRQEVQSELFNCYRSFFGCWSKWIVSLIPKNIAKQRVYRYIAKQSLLRELKSLI